MKIAIYGRKRQEEYAAALSKFFRRLADAGIEIVMHRKLYEVLSVLMPRDLAAVRQVVAGTDFKADVALSLGGDGTFLRTAMWVGDKEIPILGVNTGHLGYLASATVDDLPDVAEHLIAGEFDIKERKLIEVTAPHIDVWPYALNEVAVSKEQTASMIEAITMLDGKLLAHYKADGLIICTPTGSTAYNLSVGGPIIQPSAPVWGISPIAAHTLSMRPLVVCDSSDIEVTVTGRAEEFRLTLDGRAVTLPIGTKVKLKTAPFVVRLITRPMHGFPESLREKLGWSE